MLRLASAVLLSVAAAQAVHAQTTIDVAKITCEQFLLSRDVRSLAVWLNGYYHGQRNDPAVALERAKENARKLSSACVAAKNSKLPVMQVIEAAKAQ
jgi:hypothetical protein